jgi:hypothetical protein
MNHPLDKDIYFSKKLDSKLVTFAVEETVRDSYILQNLLMKSSLNFMTFYI